MKTNRLYNFIIFALIVLLFNVGYFLANKQSTSNIPENSAKQFSKVFGPYIDEIQSLITDQEFIIQLNDSAFKNTNQKTLLTKPFTLLTYENGVLTYWNRNNATPLKNYFTAADNQKLIKLKNGYYLQYVNQLVDQYRNITTVALLPVKGDFPIANRYLMNDFELLQNLSPKLKLYPNAKPNTIPVVHDGIELFHIGEEGQIVTAPSWWTVIIYFTGFLLLLILLYRIAEIIAIQKSNVLGLAFLFAMLMITRLILFYSNFPVDKSTISLFNPHYYGSRFAPSLGDLFLHVSLFFWFVFYIYKRFRFIFRIRKVRFRILTYFFVIAGLLTLGQFVIAIFRSIIIDSKISLDLSNILNLDVHSIVGLLIISLLILGFFLITQKVILLSQKVDLSKEGKSLILVISILLFAAFNILSRGLYFEGVVIGLFLAAYIVITLVSSPEKTVWFNYNRTIFWVIFFALFGAYLLNTYNEEKERNTRKVYARKLAIERDQATEYYFKDIESKIKQDNFVKAYFRNPYSSQKDLDKRINSLYFGGYLDKYQIQLYTYDLNFKPVKNSKEISLDRFIEKIEKNGTDTDSKHFYFVQDKNGKSKYLGNFEISSKNAIIGNLIIELKPKIFESNGGFPDFLLPGKNLGANDLANYDYAVYMNNKLLAKNGSYPFSYFFTEEIKGFPEEYKSKAEFSSFSKDNNSILIHKASARKTVMLTKRSERVFSFLSNFSYLVVLFSLILLVIVLLDLFLRLLNRQFRFRNLLHTPLKSRISIAMIGITIISFLIIGSITIFYYTRENNNYHKKRLDRKVKAVHTAIELWLNEQDYVIQNIRNIDKLKAEVEGLSQIHNMDINLFKLNGDLITASQPIVFNNGYLSRKMDPNAFYAFTQSDIAQYTHDEEIGKFVYQAAYVPIRNEDGRKVAFLSLPYYAKGASLREDISQFMIAIINVYVLLLVAAGIVAVFLSNSITSSLTAIGEKMQNIKLGGTNDPLIWPYEDEVGALVREYNKMLKELERSASKLAKNEREIAWREMAKQVAHEIKNPLTPMKLGVQHLKRAIINGDDGVEELTIKVSDTLIEQIESLSKIASEFSSFAKMPRANAEAINLNDVVEGIVDLYENHEHIEIDLKLPERICLSFADKDQLARVFNNLIKNAVQAIPENQQGIINVSLSKMDSNTYLVEVEDNGVGIPEELKDKVFVPNFTTKGSGTGLGLAISRNIIYNSGGDIYFETQTGKGTSFYVELPIYLEEERKENG